MNIIRLAYKSRMLNLDEIRCDCGTQIRQSINEDTVTEYAEAMRNGADFPEAVVFWDEYKYILADGFHRHLARARAGFKDIKVEVWLGTRAEAIRWALGANAKHGLRRTNADKRRAVEVSLKEWPQLSDRQIADLCAVSHPFVAAVRSGEVAKFDHVVTVTTSTPAPRLGADGKLYQAKQNPAGEKLESPSRTTLGAPASSRLVAAKSKISSRDLTAFSALTPEETKELWSQVPPDLKSGVALCLGSINGKAEDLVKKLGDGLVEPLALHHCQTALRSAADKIDAILHQILSLPAAKK